MEIKEVKYSAKLAIRQYENHEIGLVAIRGPEETELQVIAKLMQIVFNFHDAVYAHLKLTGSLADMRHNIDGAIHRLEQAQDDLSSQEQGLIAFAEKKPEDLTDLEYEYQKVCRTTPIKTLTEAVERKANKLADLNNDLAILTIQEAELTKLIKTGKLENFNKEAFEFQPKHPRSQMY